MTFLLNGPTLVSLCISGHLAYRLVFCSLFLIEISICVPGLWKCILFACLFFFEEILIRADDITQLKKGDLFKWNEVKGARNYICRICGPDINCTSLLGDKPSLEIPYTTLKFKRPENKPDPVQVMIEVLAVGENDVLGKGGPFNLSKYFVTWNMWYIKNVVKRGAYLNIIWWKLKNLKDISISTRSLSNLLSTVEEKLETTERAVMSRFPNP